MRRPRGPGGRFLTAEEIAAQKVSIGNGIGSVRSPSHDHDDDGEDEDAPPIMLDEGQPLTHGPYQGVGSLANALSPNHPHQHMPQPPPSQQMQSQQMQYPTNLPVGNMPMTMEASYQTMQQMHPPQATMHYSNSMYPSTDPTEMRRRTEEMIHFGARGSNSGGA